MDTTRKGSLALVGLAAIPLFLGWKLFWFLTDDAYIAFRYVSNAMLGHGYVWNPAPFLPVEGYTSFLWVVILELCWRVTGFEPPETANWMSLVFSYATLVLTSLMMLRMRWSLALRPARLFFLALFLVFLVSNRSFLTWASSGLETALFCFLVTCWVWAVVRDAPPARKVLWASVAATLIELARPDGVLFCAATVLLCTVHAFRPESRGRERLRTIAGLAPLAIVCTHFAWRWRFYGDWLPNTYYAKVSAPWPRSGLLYASSFVLEYGLWLPLFFVLWAVARAVREKQGTVGGWIVVLALASHFAYYTFLVGGDHFEYRVYNHLLPLLFVALVWAINRLDLGRTRAAGIALASVALSLPVPWTHWALTHRLMSRKKTHVMIVPITPSWPVGLRWYSGLFDDVQTWLITHHVCMRHQEHKLFWMRQVANLPSREEGMMVSSEGLPIMARGTVGVPGWVCPTSTSSTPSG